MKYFSKPAGIGALFIFIVIWLVVGTVMGAQGGGAPSSQAIAVSPKSLWVLGFLFGYFLIYTVRHGSKTQDVFKGFLGLSGAIGGAAGLTFVLKESTTQAEGLVAYATGTIYGFLAYVLIAFFLACLYSASFTYTKDQPTTGWALLAETLGKVLLGEDLRPPPSK